MVALAEELRVLNDYGWAKVKLEGCCRMCERPASVRKLTRHHLVPQAWFKDREARVEPLGEEWWELRQLRDADANIVPLCGRCHRNIERDEAARKLLRKVLAPIEATFCVQLRGLRWFNDRYPPSVRAA